VQPDSDLGARLVTREVGNLSKDEIDAALEAGAITARKLLADGLIESAALRLEGEMIVVGAREIEGSFGFRMPLRGSAAEGSIHA